MRATQPEPVRSVRKTRSFRDSRSPLRESLLLRERDIDRMRCLQANYISRQDRIDRARYYITFNSIGIGDPSCWRHTRSLVLVGTVSYYPRNLCSRCDTKSPFSQWDEAFIHTAYMKYLGISKP